MTRFTRFTRFALSSCPLQKRTAGTVCSGLGAGSESAEQDKRNRVNSVNRGVKRFQLARRRTKGTKAPVPRVAEFISQSIRIPIANDSVFSVNPLYSALPQQRGLARSGTEGVLGRTLAAVVLGVRYTNRRMVRIKSHHMIRLIRPRPRAEPEKWPTISRPEGGH
jgi:hypothetical protein